MQPCQTALKSKGAGLGGGWDVYSNGCHNECLQSQALASMGGALCQHGFKGEQSLQQPWALGTQSSPQSPGTQKWQRGPGDNHPWNLSSHAFDYLSTIYCFLNPELQTQQIKHNSCDISLLTGPCLLKIYFYKLSCCCVAASLEVHENFKSNAGLSPNIWFLLCFAGIPPTPPRTHQQKKCNQVLTGSSFSLRLSLNASIFLD